MSKRFLDEEDQSALQTELNAVRSIAENASTTVKQVSTVAQQAASAAQQAAQNASNAYSPNNKPTDVELFGFNVYGTNNITYGTAALVDGVSSLPTGHIYLQYEE